MEKLIKLKKEFEQILEKHNFNTDEKAKEIADFLTGTPREVSVDEFIEKFPMSKEEGKTVLAFIQKLVELKKKYA